MAGISSTELSVAGLTPRELQKARYGPFCWYWKAKSFHAKSSKAPGSAAGASIKFRTSEQISSSLMRFLLWLVVRDSHAAIWLEARQNQDASGGTRAEHEII